MHVPEEEESAEEVLVLEVEEELVLELEEELVLGVREELELEVELWVEELEDR